MPAEGLGAPANAAGSALPCALRKWKICACLLGCALAAYGLVFCGLTGDTSDLLSAARLSLSLDKEVSSPRQELSGAASLEDLESNVASGSRPDAVWDAHGGAWVSVTDSASAAASEALSMKTTASCRVDLDSAGKPGGKLVRVLTKNMVKVPGALFHAGLMRKYGFVKFGSKDTGQAELLIMGLLQMLPPRVMREVNAYKTLLLRKADPAIQRYMPELLYHRNLIGIFSEFTVRDAKMLNLSAEQYHQGAKYHLAVICTFPQFVNTQPCINEHTKEAKMPEFDQHQIAYEIHSKRMRTVNWNFGQYYEMEPMAASMRAKPHLVGRLFRAQKTLDVFMGVHIRDKEHTPLLLHRLAIVQALAHYTGPKIVVACSPFHEMHAKTFKVSDKYLIKRCLSGREYRAGMVKAKAVVCPWGFGERTGCDISAMLYGSVMLKPYNDWVLAYPDVYHSGSMYIAFKADASDLSSKIDHVAKHFDKYKELRERASDFCVKNVDAVHFVDRFWAEACDAYLNHNEVAPYKGVQLKGAT